MSARFVSAGLIDPTSTAVSPNTRTLVSPTLERGEAARCRVLRNDVFFVEDLAVETAPDEVRRDDPLQRRDVSSCISRKPVSLQLRNLILRLCGNTLGKPTQRGPQTHQSQKNCSSQRNHVRTPVYSRQTPEVERMFPALPCEHLPAQAASVLICVTARRTFNPSPSPYREGARQSSAA